VAGEVEWKRCIHPCDLREQRGTQGERASPFRCKRGKEVRENLPILLVTHGSLSLPFTERMASRAKEGEMLSTEELQSNHQLLSQIYTSGDLANAFTIVDYIYVSISDERGASNVFLETGAFCHSALNRLPQQ